VTSIRPGQLLEAYYNAYHHPGFILQDPISVPKQFSRQQDIEIMGLWTAVLSWGNRKTILQKANELVTLMDNAPYDFILGHKESDLERFRHFKHRTFQLTDTLYFIHFFRRHYLHHTSLEDAFLSPGYATEPHVEKMLIYFHNYFFDDPFAPSRTRKHISTPASGSACKRLNMFLRWMVRKDTQGIDFGIWHHLRTEQLVCPLDVHVERVARKLQLIQSGKSNWAAAVELTKNLKKYDAQDPVRFDFALFGAGVSGVL